MLAHVADYAPCRHPGTEQLALRFVGVVRAFLCAFIRVAPAQMAMVGASHLTGISPDEHPLGIHI